MGYVDILRFLRARALALWRLGMSLYRYRRRMIVRAVLPAVLAVLAIQVLLFQQSVSPVTGGACSAFYPDAFGRLLQVEHLWKSGDWFDRTSPGANAPFGVLRHWSRPFDALMIAGAWPLSLFMPPRDALMRWGCVISPLLQLASVLMLGWGTRGLIRARYFPLLALLFCFQPVTAVFFSIARPDHHSLLLFLAVAVFAALLRWTRDPARPGPPIVAAIGAGLGLWVSVEAIVTAGVASLALGAVWLFRGGRERLGSIVLFLTVLALSAAASLVLERPPAEWGRAEYDLISVVHVLLVTATAATWAVLNLWPGSARLKFRGRLGACAVGAIVPAVATFLVFPRFFAGPFADIDPRILQKWIVRLQEYRPLITAELQDIGLAVFRVGPILVAGGWLIWTLRRGEGKKRDAALSMSIFLAVFLALAFIQVRWAGYVGALMIVPWCAALAAILAWKQKDGTRRLSLNILLFLAALLGHFVLGAALLTAAGGGPDWNTATRDACDWRSIEAVLRAKADAAGRPLLILSYIHQGPELLYRSGQQVVGTPYHRNVRGILDTIDAFSSATDARARAMVRERQVDLLLGCRNSTEIQLYRPAEERTYFLGELLAGRPPAWLHPVPLPQSVRDQFFLFEVVGR